MTLTHGPATEPAETNPSGAPTRSGHPSQLASAILLLAGAVLQVVSSLLAPNTGPDGDWDVEVAAMLDDDAFVPSHVLEFVSVAMMLAAVVMIARSPVVRTLRAMRSAAIALAVGLGIALAGLVSFMLSAREAEEVLDGGSTPLFDTHVTVQAFATPIIGVSIAILAVLDARRSPRWTWIPAVLAVVGGLIAAVSGPAIAITRDLSATSLFAGFVGVSLWLIVTAVRRLVAVRRTTDVALT